jgi:hypothetical protein
MYIQWVGIRITSEYKETRGEASQALPSAPIRHSDDSLWATRTGLERLLFHNLVALAWNNLLYKRIAYPPNAELHPSILTYVATALRFRHSICTTDPSVTSWTFRGSISSKRESEIFSDRSHEGLGMEPRSALPSYSLYIVGNFEGWGHWPVVNSGAPVEADVIASVVLGPGRDQRR